MTSRKHRNWPDLARRVYPGSRYRRPLRNVNDFNRLWAAETVSQFGSQITLITIPLLAVLTLDASPFQIGLLMAMGQIPSFLFSLFAGPLVDRFPKRPLMIAADLGRALALMTIWIASRIDLLSMELLYMVSFIAGTLTLLYGVAYQSYVPALVGRNRLVDANSKLESSASLAQIAGPGIGGILIGVFTAPAAVLFDVASYVISSVTIASIRVVELPPVRTARVRLRYEIGTGIAFIRSERVLRGLAGSSVSNNFFGMMYVAVFVPFLVRELHLGPSSVGIVFAVGGAGALVGALIAGPVSARIGIGTTIILAQVGLGVSGLLIPLALFVPRVDVWLVLAVEFIQFIMLLLSGVNSVSLRQAMTPHDMYGRVNGGFRFLTFGMQPFGSLAGGMLGGLIGLAPTLVVAQAGICTALIWLLASPLRACRTVPDGQIDGPEAIREAPEPAPAESMVFPVSQ